MLRAMDRVVMVAEDAAATAAGWEALLDARAAGSSDRPALGARAHHWRLGDGWLEVLTPEADGVVARALAERGPHLFAGGFTSEDFDGFAAHLRRLGLQPLEDGDRLMLDTSCTGVPGLRLFVADHDPQPPVGLIDTFYELTDLVADASAASARAAEVLALDPARFAPIASEPYGYRGTLTQFDRRYLDRLELITPEREGTTMHRYFRRRGESLYMAFAETGLLGEIERRAVQSGAGHTAEPPPGERDGLGAHTVFLHPAALGGVMLGLSRRGHAWSWSGQPERVAQS